MDTVAQLCRLNNVVLNDAGSRGSQVGSVLNATSSVAAEQACSKALLVQALLMLQRGVRAQHLSAVQHLLEPS